MCQLQEVEIVLSCPDLLVTLADLTNLLQKQINTAVCRPMEPYIFVIFVIVNKYLELYKLHSSKNSKKKSKSPICIDKDADFFFKWSTQKKTKNKITC